MWRKGNPLALWVGVKTGAATQKQYGVSSKKLKVELPSHSAIALPRIYSKNTETIIYIPQCLFLAPPEIAKLWKQPKCPATISVSVDIHTYTCNGILLS